jgi:hypothetical protein
LSAPRIPGTRRDIIRRSAPLSYDENSSPQFTKSLLLNQVPVVTIGGVDYYEFRLDINQTNNNPLLSLNELKVYTSTTANYSGEIDSPTFTGSTTLVWDLDDQNLDGTDDTDNTVCSIMTAVRQRQIGHVLLCAGQRFRRRGPRRHLCRALFRVRKHRHARRHGWWRHRPLLYGDYSSNDGFEEWSVSKALEGPLISGFKFNDVNGNGQWDSGEEGLGGWKIDYSLTYKDGNGANALTVTVTGTATTSDGTTDLDGDGNLDPVGFYIISVPLGAANNTQYTLTLTEVLQDGWRTPSMAMPRRT